MKQHIQHAQHNAAGPAVPIKHAASTAATQAAWRFFQNEKVTPKRLIEPLRDFAKTQIPPDTHYVLHVFDWCNIDYKKHKSKKDTTTLTHDANIGYDLTTQLAVDADTGKPIAPVQMHLKTADGMLSTFSTPPDADTNHLDQILSMMKQTAKMKLGAQPVFVIDREADAVLYLRQWAEAGQFFLVRGDDDRKVLWRGEETLISSIKTQADVRQAFVFSRKIMYHDKPALQYVYETEIVLHRPANREYKKKRFKVSGEPISLRLVIAKVLDPVTKKEVACWHLLSNIPLEVASDRVALWYYYRWKIESYFKLMKSGGQELEHWQQESGGAVLKRLLVASMASAVVWSLQRDESEEAEEFKELLVRLSGKSRKRGRPPTDGALLAGLFVLLRLFDLLDLLENDPQKILDLRQTFQKLLPNL